MNPTEIIDKSWIPVLSQLHQEPLKSLYEELLPNISYQPLKEDIFRVFEMPVNKIKVVILGQDPYPTPGDAVGLAFATRAERKLPASLRIIIQEIGESVYSFSREDFKPTYDDSDWKTLDHWRKQGVFLLNTALTVETGRLVVILNIGKNLQRKSFSIYLFRILVFGFCGVQKFKNLSHILKVVPLW